MGSGLRLDLGLVPEAEVAVQHVFVGAVHVVARLCCQCARLGYALPWFSPSNVPVQVVFCMLCCVLRSAMLFAVAGRFETEGWAMERRKRDGGGL